MKPLGTPQVDKDPGLITCLKASLEPGESFHICQKCGCPYLQTSFYQRDICIYCSDNRSTTGPTAREKNRRYARNYIRKKAK